MFYYIKNDFIYLKIWAKPGANNSSILGCHGEYLKGGIKARPVEGAANNELIKFLAKLFNVRQAQVQIVQGSGSKQKVVQLPATESVKNYIRSLV